MMKIVEEKDYEPLSSNDLNVSFAKRLIDVVRENIDNTEFNRDLFAQLMHVSTSLLYKKVKAITNESPTDFIRNIRLNHAVTLIKTGRYTMTEISEKCGFANPSYFSTAFKKQYGKSPKDFK